MTDFQTLFERSPENRRTSTTSAAGLALSGGGFRAMLFHVGALRRLCEVGALQRVARVSSVSGGSIAAAMLASNWSRVVNAADPVGAFTTHVQQPLFGFAASKLDVKAGVSGLLRPKRSIAVTVARSYDELFDRARLQGLPDAPRFVFCATNMGSGSLVRFAKPYTADYRIGKRDHLDLALSTVVAASAAFPPVLSPMVITLDDTQALTQLFPVKPGEEPEPLAGRAPYTHRLELSDGGVYDNLGLQPVEQMHTVLVSDGGGPFEFEEDVAVNWLSHMIRAWKVTDRQVRALRRAGLVAEFKRDERFGAFWSIQTDYQSYPDRRLPVHEEWADYLASIPTRLTTVPVDQRKQLINWAYSLTDAALRSFVAPGITPDPVWPYPENPLDVAPTVASKPWWKRW